MTEASGGERGDQQITNQLASLVPSFDPSKDDMQTYKQKVEIVLGAWPKSRITELTTRLILNTQGSAFQTLQLHHHELMANEEKSVTRLIELLGGQWGRIGLEQQYQDIENALYHTTQKSDESHDSFLARADVLWSKALARKLTLSDLQAFVTLRGSLLSPDEKKRVILDADQSLEGKLTVNRVREAIRVLGASFFASMTGQKNSGKNKVYDATTLHVEHQDDAQTADGLVATDDGGYEEDFIEALAQEGEDEDAVLVADFEALAADTIQEDSELAQAYTAYADARRRLSEKFRNRGFWPVSRNPAQSKGKGFGGKPGGRGKGGFNQLRPRKTLQERIMQSNCRACGRRGHWKAECPFKSSNSSTSSQPATTAPTTTVIADQDVLPLEFVKLPFLTPEASCPIPEEPNPVSITTREECFFQWGWDTHDSTARKRLRDSIQDYRDRIHYESRVDNVQLCQSSRNRIAALNRRSKTPSSTCETMSPGECFPDPEPHDMTSKSENIQRIRSSVIRTTDNPEATVCFATHGTMGILDSGASKTVVGSDQLSSLIHSFEPSLRSQLRRSKCSITFRFGNQGTLQSSEALIVPLGRMMLRIAIVQGGTPFLLSNTLLRSLQATVDCASHVLNSPLLAKPVSLHLSPKGLFLIDLNELAIQASLHGQPKSDVSAIRTPTETFMSEDVENEQLKVSSDDTSSNHDVDQLHQGSNSDFIKCDSQNVCPEQPPVTPLVQNSNVQTQVQEIAANSTDCDHLHHGDVDACSKAAPSSDASPSGGGGSESFDSGGTVLRDSELRTETSGQDLCQSMDGSRMGELHGESIQPKHKDWPPQVPALRGAQAGSARTAADRHPIDPGRQCAHRAIAASAKGSFWSQGQGQEHGIRHTIVPPRHGGRLGSGTRPISINDYDLKLSESGSPCTGTTDAEHGECTHACGSAPGESSQPDPSARAGDLRLRLSEDWSAEIHTMISQERMSLKRLILRFEAELQQALSNHRPMGKPCNLLEVFCSDSSPLTHQMQQQHGHAFRFGLSQGNLSSDVGRAKLFGLVARHRPNDIWVSPDCGPWSSWSQLNASRSLEHQQWYETIRHALLYQIAICIVLFRHQVMQSRHFHWEQPAKSLMFAHPGLAEVHQHTYACQFDMCTVGELKDPQNGLYMKKGMTILTTRRYLYQHLHGRTCNKTHQHQPMEGTVQTDQGPMLRTLYSAIYPRKFARTIVKLIKQDTSSAYAFAATAQRRKATFVRSELVTPAARPEQEAKRRRLDGK